MFWIIHVEWEGIVFIHDGVRPFVNDEIIARTLEAAETYGACVAAMPVKETIKLADENDFVNSTPSGIGSGGFRLPRYLTSNYSIKLTRRQWRADART